MSEAEAIMAAGNARQTDRTYDGHADLDDPITTYSGQWLGARIARADEGDAYALTWTDYVINDWRADYPTMAQAHEALRLLLADEYPDSERTDK